MKKRLDISLMKSRLSEEAVGCPLFYAETMDSTNEWAKREGALGATDKSVYLTDKQTAGKGRRGRSWQSPEGETLSFSLLLRPDLPLTSYSMLTLVMGMAAADGMTKVVGSTCAEKVAGSSDPASGEKASSAVNDITVGIKWPNDVVCHGKKLCGILTEMSSKGDYVVIGIGINVNNREFPEELQATGSSLALECGADVSREEVLVEVLKSFFFYYEKFREAGDLSLLQEDYNHLLVSNGERVRVLDLKAPYEGIALGINPSGELLVRREDNGRLEQVFAGEVSVRGIYGYC